MCNYRKLQLLIVVLLMTLFTQNLVAESENHRYDKQPHENLVKKYSTVWRNIHINTHKLKEPYLYDQSAKEPLLTYFVIGMNFNEFKIANPDNWKENYTQMRLSAGRMVRDIVKQICLDSGIILNNASVIDLMGFNHNENNRDFFSVYAGCDVAS